jgi:hypothetical protein
VTVIDADTHLYEGRELWAEHADPDQRHLALRIADDELGHAWLMLGDRRIHLAEVHHPGDVPSMGVYRQRVREGLPAELPYDEALPRHFWDPGARRDGLDDMGLDEAVVFPAEGLAHPLEDYQRLCGPVEEAAADRLYAGNVAWLLGTASP